MFEAELAAQGERIVALQDDVRRIESKVDCLDRKLGEVKTSVAEIRSAWKTGLQVAGIAGAAVGALVTALSKAWGL